MNIQHPTHNIIVLQNNIQLCQKCGINVDDIRIEDRCPSTLVSRNNYYNSGSYSFGTGSDLE
jgi:hypothetical protein